MLNIPAYRLRLMSGSGVLGRGHATRAAISAPSTALPRRRALCTNCDIRELWRDRILAQIQGRKALRRTRALTRADVQPADAHRHVAEQGAKPRPIMTLAGQHAPARATALTHYSHLGRHDLSLECCRELLRLGELKPKLGQAGLLIALDAGNFGFCHHPRPQLRNQLHPPHQLPHQPILFP